MTDAAENLVIDMIGLPFDFVECFEDLRHDPETMAGR